MWQIPRILALVVAALGLSCCTAAAQQDTLAAVTKAAAKLTPAILEEREAAGARCFDGQPTAASADECLATVRASWAPVWSALDALELADESALAGSVELATVGRAYCALSRALPDKLKTQLPSVPGVSCP